MKNEGKIFVVRFVKKDGTVRAMKCRTGVKKALKGGELKYDPNAKGLKVVFDLTANAYRMINANTVYEIRLGGKTYLNNKAQEILTTL